MGDPVSSSLVTDLFLEMSILSEFRYLLLTGLLDANCRVYFDSSRELSSFILTTFGNFSFIIFNHNIDRFLFVHFGRGYFFNVSWRGFMRFYRRRLENVYIL